MARFYSGMSGSVAFTGGTVRGAKGWELTTEADASGYSNWDSSDWEGTFTGVKRWSGTITTDLDKFTAPVATGTSGTVTLHTGSGQKWSGAIKVTGIRNMASKGADVVEITYSFRGDGALTEMTIGVTATGTAETSWPVTHTATAAGATYPVTVTDTVG